MNTSISHRPKNDSWPAGHAPPTSVHGARELPEVRAPRDHEHGLDVEDDEQHRDHVELHREPLARVAEHGHAGLVRRSASPRSAAGGGSGARSARISAALSDDEPQEQQDRQVRAFHESPHFVKSFTKSQRMKLPGAAKQCQRRMRVSTHRAKARRERRSTLSRRASRAPLARDASPPSSEPSAHDDHVRPLDHPDGYRARHDRALRGPPGARGGDLVRGQLLRLRHARRPRVPDLHERAELDRRPEELRREAASSSSRATSASSRRTSFALARSVEYFRIPRNVLTVTVGKSTYARCGIITNVTPFEPEWEGYVTLEISNTTPLPAKIYANEGIAQVLFFEGRRGAGGLVRGQEGEVPGPARRDAAAALSALSGRSRAGTRARRRSRGSARIAHVVPCPAPALDPRGRRARGARADGSVPLPVT